MITKDMSDHLNGLARKLTTKQFNNLPILYKTFNGSCIPFIGKEWVDVDFTLGYCHIACLELNGKKYVGFNESLEFDHYPYFTIKNNDFNIIKSAFFELYLAVNNAHPVVSAIELALSKIHDNLYEFSEKLEIIKE